MSAVLNSPHARDIASLLHGMTNPLRLEREGPLILEEGHGVYVRTSRATSTSRAWRACGARRSGSATSDSCRRRSRRCASSRPTTPSSSAPPCLPSSLAERLLAIRSGAHGAGMVRQLRLRGERPHGASSSGTTTTPAASRRRRRSSHATHGYHGIAVSSASLTGLPAMHKGFDLPIPNVLHTGSHNYSLDSLPGESEEEFATRRAEELEQLILAEGPDTVAAFVAEPVLGAGGAVIPPRTYFEKIQAVLAKYDVLMVADEVITGFFRTGNRFACETFGIRARHPDAWPSSSRPRTCRSRPWCINEKIYGPIRELAGKNGHPRHRLHLLRPPGARPRSRWRR